MSYKWKPSKSARREFAQQMNNNPEFAQAYNERKETKAEKRRSTSQFDYNTAGGNYIPTKAQYDFCMNKAYFMELTSEQLDAINMVCFGYTCNEKVHHDSIHIVNELIRSL